MSNQRNKKGVFASSFENLIKCKIDIFREMSRPPFKKIVFPGKKSFSMERRKSFFVIFIHLICLNLFLLCLRFFWHLLKLKAKINNKGAALFMVSLRRDQKLTDHLLTLNFITLLEPIYHKTKQRSSIFKAKV